VTQDTLVNVCKCISNIFLRLEIYFEVQAPLMAAMSKLTGKIMVEVLNTLAIMTKENQKSQTSVLPFLF
jgi:hypothetical protein